MMYKAKGFVLLEIMMALAIGLSLLSTFMILWIALSKSSHQEIKRFEATQNYMEAVSYLRQVLSRTIYRPHCPNVEWLRYQGESESIVVKKIVSRLAQPVIVHEYSERHMGLKAFPVDDLVGHMAKLVTTSSVVEMIRLTPLQLEDQSRIVNSEDVKGAREGYVLATDCRNYVVGEYQRSQRNEAVLSQPLINDISNYLRREDWVQYYKINRELLYVIRENGEDQLIHNFLDGSNYMRLSGINIFLVKFADELDTQLLLFQMAKEPFYIRLYNL